MAESPPPYTPSPSQTNPYHEGYDQPGDNQQKYGQQPYPPPPTAQQPYPALATGQYPMGAFPPPPQSAVSTQVTVTQVSSNPVVVGYIGRDYTCAAIMACLCCCWPFGIVAIYYAARAQDEYRSGHMEEAERCQGRARIFIGLSVTFGVVICVIAAVVGAIARSNMHNY